MTTRRFVKFWYKRRLQLATCLQWLSGSQPSPDSGLEPSIHLVLRDINRYIFIKQLFLNQPLALGTVYEVYWVTSFMTLTKLRCIGAGGQGGCRAHYSVGN